MLPRERVASLEAVLPGSTKQFRCRIIRHAHKLSMARTGVDAYNDLVVMSIIRASIKKIRKGVNGRHVKRLFNPEVRVETKYPILPLPDPSCYLIPNETWAGKGSGGKTNFSATIE